MAKRLTPTAQWLAAGYRYDDVALWRELCEWLEQHGATPGPALPAHLAPLVRQEPANTYLCWLHEQHLMPVVRLSGMTERGGNGWQVKRDWQDRLAVLADPTPERRLTWWRALASAWNVRIVRVMEERDVFIPDAPRLTYNLLLVPHYLCPFCKERSWSTDPRGVLHRWSAMDRVVNWDRPILRSGYLPRYENCPVIRLRLAIRAAERADRQGTDSDAVGLANELGRLALHYRAVGGRDAAQLRQERSRPNYSSDNTDWSGQEVLQTRGAATYHVAQLCALWIEPSATSILEYVAFLRREADCSHGLGARELEEQVASVYLEAASELEHLLA